ncbi:hypothetical protein [Paenibacillus xylanexedens]|uniref:hypothetical protein n=1 Tax=Paenibacillus xylanexedens TaxID=528191 RepID=UPI0011A9236F|nr:hypothetical protein [Paenibacillus xylanexedens]
MSTAQAANIYWRNALLFELQDGRMDEFKNKETFYSDFAYRYGISSATVKKQVLALNKDSNEQPKGETSMSVPAGNVALGPALPADSDLTSDGSAVTNALAKKLNELRKKPGYVTNGEYILGCLVEVKVTRIEDTYVKLTTTDGLDTEVILMIRDVTDKFVNNLHYHFMINDILVAEVKRIDERGRLTITTMGLPLPDYQINPRQQHISRVSQNKPGLNFPEVHARTKATPTPQQATATVPPAPMTNPDLADKLAAVKDDIVLTDRPAEDTAKGPKKMSAETTSSDAANDTTVKELKKVEEEATVSLDIPDVSDSEMRQIHRCLAPIVGEVSAAADDYIAKLIAEYGIVGFSVAMARVVHGFNADLSLIMAKEIDQLLAKAN